MRLKGSISKRIDKKSLLSVIPLNELRKTEIVPSSSFVTMDV